MRRLLFQGGEWDYNDHTKEAILTLQELLQSSTARHIRSHDEHRGIEWCLHDEGPGSTFEKQIWFLNLPCRRYITVHPASSGWRCHLVPGVKSARRLAAAVIDMALVDEKTGN